MHFIYIAQKWSIKAGLKRYVFSCDLKVGRSEQRLKDVERE